MQAEEPKQQEVDMRKVLVSIGLVGLALANTGCLATYLSAKSSQRELATERIMVSGNKDAIDAVKMGVPAEDAIRAIPIAGGVGIGVNLLDWQTLSKNPLRQTGAALLDAAWMYGAYQLTQSGNNNSSSSKSTTYNIDTANSDHTTVTINQNETTTTTTTTTDTQTDSHSGNGNNR
jgi:hypothetical protein